MAYVTSSQIVSRLGNDTAVRLTTESGSTVDTALINTIIAEVEAMINAALRSRTALSINQAEHPQSFAMLRGFATTMVIHRLYTDRRQPVPKEVETDVKRMDEWLIKLAEGKVNLPDATLNEPGMSWGSHDQDAARQR